ncbi:MAG: ATP-binding protein [Candidatus Thiodiazotropha endolucinida]
MKLKSVILKNYRRYKDEIRIPIENLTAFIGKNDAGKSTVLEALDIFFENDTTRIESADASVDGDNKDVRIGAVFSELPDRLGLDVTADTTLEAEHLLNPDNDLEIVKVFNCSLAKPNHKVFARAVHPVNEGLSDLLQKKNADLKKMVKEAGVEANCQLTSNPSMRQALYGTVALECSLVEVPLNDAEAKNIWEAIKKHLPIFALFRSDRSSSDQDPEVQNPMKLAIKKALADLEGELEEISNQVKAMAEETANRTIEQLKESYPDLELASVLQPQFKKPKWDSVFKLDLESDDNIPLNKRGSGVRRMVLLSFFQAEAARKQSERGAAGQTNTPVIYAVEEPETSQHPDSQRLIIKAFSEIAKGGDQVMITTHVPGLAELIPTPSLRFIDLNEGSVRVREGSDEVFTEIAEALGVLPIAQNTPSAKVAVAVEGPTDIDALISFGNILNDAGVVIGFYPEKVFWTIGGGETLKDWVERKYLDRIGIPQIFFFDSDRTSENLPVDRDKEQRIEEISQRANCVAFLSKKRTIENYLHPDALKRVTDGNITLPEETDWNYSNIAKLFKTAFDEAKRQHGKDLNFNPTDHEGNPLGIKSSESRCKRIITAYIMRQMTKDEVIERGKYTEGEDEHNEVIDWINSIVTKIQ